MNTNNLLGFDFNDEQITVLQLLNKFIDSNYSNPRINITRTNIKALDELQRIILSEYPRFLLSGSAGTGKTSLITYIIFTSWCNKLPITASPKYIICAPTNKAKDVLMNKFIALRDKFLQILDTEPDNANQFRDIKHKCTKLVEFKTLSQVLGINITINNSGEQEFTKGNIEKIRKRYAKKDYARTTIIIDECSMIDLNAFKKCQAIPKPVIYLGDPCQLPPVNEDFSEVFHLPDFDNELWFFMLKQVMRSKDVITSCCNYMRDIILKSDKDCISFKDINTNYAIPKNKYIRFYNKKPQSWLKRYVERCTSSNIPNDMGLCWTNSRCSSLNNKVREILYCNQNGITGSDTKNVNVPYIMSQEKIIVKNSYYNYDTKCYTSLILRVNSFTSATYKPPSLLEWIKIGIYNHNAMILKSNSNDNYEVNGCIDNINDNNKDLSTLEQQLDLGLNIKREQQKNKGTLFQFGFKGEKNTGTESNSQEEIIAKQKQEFCNSIRTKFYSTHNYYQNSKEWLDKKQKTTIIPDNIMITDPFIKGDMVYNNYNNIEESLDTNNNYLIRHKNITTLGFGIPIEKMHCSVCEFFSQYLLELIRTKDYIAIQFLALTQNITLGCYLCHATDKNGCKYEFPILDEQTIDSFNDIKRKAKSLLASCGNKRLNLNTTQVNNLKKLLETNNMDELLYSLMSSNNTLNSNNIRSVPYALLFGHYWNHVFVDTLLDWDYGYFITTHKSQGSDYDEVFVDGSNLLKNGKITEKDKLIYTGLSRAKSRLNIYL